jgi:hypothetical protein
MADFGAGIISRASDRRGEFSDRLFRQAALYEQGRQFDQSLKRGKDLSMDERDLQMIQRYQAGDRSPEVQSYIDARKAMETGKTTYSPDAYGNVRAVPASNPFDMLMENTSQPTLMDRHRAGEIGQPIIDDGTAYSSKDDAMVDRLMSLAQYEEETPQNPLSPQQWESMVMSGDTALPVLPEASDAYANSPVGDIESGKANVEVQKAGSMLPVKGAEADIAASQRGAETYAGKTAENQAELEAKLSPLDNMIGELEALGTDTVSKLPGGGLESLGARASDFLNSPSEQALAQAKLDTALPYLMGQAKALVRQPGEGTWTDADQMLINKMFIGENESLQSKIQKYNDLLSIMKRARGRITGQKEEFLQKTQSKPGFKYLGPRK